MIEYRVECQVDDEVAQAWETYFLDHHLEDVFNSGCFLNYTFTKDSDTSKSFVIFVSTYYCESIGKLDEYNLRFAPALKDDIMSKFEGKFKAYRKVFHILKQK